MLNAINITLNKSFLEDIYLKYNNRKYLFSDPVYFVHQYKEKEDMEISAFISSSLAYGNIGQIKKSLTYIFSKMGKSPYFFLMSSPENKIKNIFKNFKHRFTDGNELSDFLIKIKKAYKIYGSLENLFLKNYDLNAPHIYFSIYSFINSFSKNTRPKTLLPSPQKQSAFKRFNLFLRWMVRKDNIDIGIWRKIKASQLIIPLDTHMHKIAKEFKLTKRNDTSIKTAIEITNAFKKINPQDPLKYDFALTRTKILKNDRIFNLLKKEEKCR